MYILKTTGERELIAVDTAKQLDLKRMQEIVGGYIEYVFPRKTPSVVMIVNEDGYAKQLPVNAAASELYVSDNDIICNPIVGDVIVMSRQEYALHSKGKIA